MIANTLSIMLSRAATCCVVALLAVVVIGGCTDVDANDAPPSSVDDSAKDAKKPQGKPIDLGAFRFREARPVEGQQLDVRFEVVAVVRPKKAQAFQRAVDQTPQQIREQILTAARTAESPEFDDPQLAQLRRRIQLRLNRFLGAPVVDEILLAKFQYKIDTL